MITFQCYSCGVQLKVKDEAAGRTGKCPGCGRVVIAPAAMPPDDPAESSSVVKALLEGSSVFPVQTGVSPDDCSFLRPAEGPDELGRLGPYRVLKVLGAGAMGIVFRAEDPGLKRMVALKVLKAHVAARTENRQRFLREAQATANLDHDHVVTVYQVGEDRGVPYLAMKLLKGESLETRLQQAGWVPTPELLRLAQESADGLAAAHARGLIHRDIKPTNIWLESETDRVKLIDFGLARVTGDSSKLTETGFVVGTPAYMAPEQACGQPADARCDLFSLGCVLYRASTGHVPFKGRDVIEMVTSLRTHHPPEPRQLAPHLPPLFADTVMALISKDPAERPASARVVREMFKHMRQAPAGPTSAFAPPRPPSKPEIAAPKPPATQQLLYAAAAVGLVLALALALRFLLFP